MSTTSTYKTPESKRRANLNYNNKHPEKVKYMTKTYYDNNSDEINQKKRDIYANRTPEERKRLQQKYYANQKDKQKAKRLAAKLEKKLLLSQQSELIAI